MNVLGCIARSLEPIQVPPRHLRHNIIERGLKKSRRSLSRLVLYLSQLQTKRQLGGYERERVTGCLGGQSRAPGQARVHLDYVVLQ